MADCPCYSKVDYDECCGPIIRGERKAPTAEVLMRSRYTAYAEGHIDHIKKTMIPSSQDDFDPDSARSWSEDSEWLGLEILSTEGGGKDDSEGVVEFVANYIQAGKSQVHHEVSQFRRVDGNWYLVDGKLIGQDPYVRSEQKVGRNEPCPCGSGKKYKKCCAK